MDEADMETVLETLLRAHVAVIEAKKQAEETLKVLEAEQENITHAMEVISNMLRATSSLALLDSDPQ